MVRLEKSNEIIYKSDVMHQTMKMARRVAASNASVLVLGETGTGKEMIAHFIHEQSNRRLKPFVAINCGALRETLLESELFGHEKGAFTGAYSRKIGLAEVANGGTLFLDEVGELSPGMQAKLLRFLQEGEFYRVGGKGPIKVDVRVVTATNRNLDSEVMKGNFREDLYYRINTITMHLPELKRRAEDIPLLIQHFLKNKEVSPDAMRCLINYPWPGNVRELINCCERLQVLVHDTVVQLSDIPDPLKNPEKVKPSFQYDPDLSLYDLERQYIQNALNYFDGNKTQAANALGITIKTLYNKLHEYGEFDSFVRSRNE